MEYQIPIYNFESMKTRFEKLVKRAVKLGLVPMTFKEVRRETILVSGDGDEYAPKKFMEFVFVEVTGESPRINGWEFIASIDHEKEGNILRRFNKDSAVPDNYLALTSSTCDHCHQNRRRNSTFILKNEAGEFKQVGSNCLKDFLGFNASPEMLAEQASVLADLAAGNGGGDGDHCSHGGYLDNSIRPYILYALAVIRRDTYYRSRAKAEETQKPSTSDKVSYEVNATTSKKFFDSLTADQQDKLIIPSQEDKDQVEKVLAWGKAIEPKSEFEQNLKIVLSKEHITHKHTGIAIAGVWSYLKANGLTPDYKFANMEPKVISQFIGEVGQKIQDIKATLVLVRVIKGDQFTSTLLKFKDEKGNLLSWFASNPPHWVSEDRVNIPVIIKKATVKGRNTYREQNETVITRAKVEDVSPVSTEKQGPETLGSAGPHCLTSIQNSYKDLANVAI
jgi:hypothetical protein